MDIVERMRDGHWPLMQEERNEAAAEITRLRSLVERLGGELIRREENERRHCLNWGPCSRMDERTALKDTEEG